MSSRTPPRALQDADITEALENLNLDLLSDEDDSINHSSAVRHDSSSDSNSGSASEF